MNPDASPAEQDSLLLDFFKALAEPARLRIAARLAGGPASVPALAVELGIPVRDCARDVRQLVDLGLVREDGNQRPPVYQLDKDWLRERSRTMLDSPRSRALAGASDERSRVLASFFRAGRLLAIPTGDLRKFIVLDEVARRFEAGRTYTEQEVSALLKEVYEYDYVSLRRLLVDFHYLNRNQGVYWIGEGRRDPAAAAERMTSHAAESHSL
jgi:hypothetical protein